MKDYRSTEEKFEFSDRMSKVREEILPRLQCNRCRESTTTSPAKNDRKMNPFIDVMEENPDDSLILMQAKGIVRSWEVTPVMIFRNEIVVGITRPIYPLHEHFSWGILEYGNMNKSGIGDLPDEQITPEMKEHYDQLRKRFNPLTYHYIDDEGVRLMGQEAYSAMRSDGCMNPGGYQGHTVPGYPRLLEYGLDGMLDYIDKCSAENSRGKETDDFYEACRIIIRGMQEHLLTYSKEASRLAENEADEEQKRTYQCIAENCSFVAHHKPVTLYHAVQLAWVLCLWDWVDCVGRGDQYFYPFYQKSKTEGDVFPTEDLIASIMMKYWEHGVHNLTVGGVDKNGSDASNELTYLMLQILRNIHDTHPRMTVRFHENSPKELMKLVIRMWSEGMSDPTVVSDTNVIPGLMKIGVPIEDARDYTILGCQEIEIPGQSNTGCEDGVINIAKIFEYTLYNGHSTSRKDVVVGPQTGEFVDFETFEDFFAAFETQIRYFTKIFIELCNRGQECRAANVAKLVKTPFTNGCLEKGMSHDMGGPIYNYGVVETGGATVIGDSLIAIKKLVFEEKKISKETLMEALKANFNGYEKERNMLLNFAPKFGNDNDEADEMSVRVLNLFWDEIAKYKSVRGGVFTGACSLLEGGIEFGRHMGAMPDGRYAGEPLGNTMGPRPGADKNGVTAMLSSVAKLPLEKGVGGTTLNVVLTSKLLSEELQRENIAAVLKAYLEGGGQMAQITTANVEDLKDAQIHPERHGDLIIRIGGFSIQFVQLYVDSQNEVISRYSEADA